MNKVINVVEAKNKLTQLLRRVERGGEHHDYEERRTYSHIDIHESI